MIWQKLTRYIALLLMVFAAQPFAAAEPLETFYWRAVSMGGRKLDLEPSQIPHIAFHKESNRIAGFGGCNRFFALYEQVDLGLTITVMGGGRAQCPDLGDLERNFLGILQGTKSYHMDGNVLLLMREDAVLGEFRGVER